MESNPSSFPLPTNRNAVISLLSAILTLLSFCIGAAPIPLTSLVCYPASIFLGLIALVTGTISLQQIRQNGGGGRFMAWAGIGIGGLTILAVLCAIALVALSLPSLEQYIQQAGSQIQH